MNETPGPVLPDDIQYPGDSLFGPPMSTTPLVISPDEEAAAIAAAIEEEATARAEGDDPNEIHLGFSAEAVAAIDPGLVSYGPVEGCKCPPNEESPDTPCECEQAPLDVRYDRLTVQLLGVAQRQRTEIATLTATVEALTARIETLESNE